MAASAGGAVARARWPGPIYRRAHRGRVVNYRVPDNHLVEHVGVRLVLGGDVHEELLHVPVEDGAEVGIDAEREDRLVVRCEV